MVDQDLPHHLRRYSQEMASAAVIRLPLANQPGVGFVDQRRGLKRMPWPFVTQLIAGKPAQLGVDRGQKVI
jgi:hypothetical protein